MDERTPNWDAVRREAVAEGFLAFDSHLNTYRIKMAVLGELARQGFYHRDVLVEPGEPIRVRTRYGCAVIDRNQIREVESFARIAEEVRL